MVSIHKVPVIVHLIIRVISSTFRFKRDSALRLAHHLLHYDRISLGIGEVDWEIDMAIQKFGGNPRTGYRYTAHFSFNAETEMEKERYEEIFNGKE